MYFSLIVGGDDVVMLKEHFEICSINMKLEPAVDYSLRLEKGGDS